jgi:hypothetical protein
MNSDKLDMLLFTRHYLQNLDFHLTKVPNDKINRKEEKEMERTFRLRKKSFGFDKKGMILKGIVSNDEQCIFVRAFDIYLDNKDIMSDKEIETCFINGSEFIWSYWMSELESLNPIIPLSKLEYELLKYYSEHGYQYIAKDKSNQLFVYGNKPCKMSCTWDDVENFCECNFKNLFSFVSWEDKEPTLIQDILNRYEVIENEKI